MESEIKREYYENGNIKSEKYFQNNQLHREDGPAESWHHENGQIESEDYYQNDIWHRENDPASIWYDENGDIVKEEYWEYGEEMDVIKEMVIRGLQIEFSVIE